eukprot:COSAG05_NODE_2550_length_2913_cov_5.862829_1_plen_801_part_00
MSRAGPAAALAVKSRTQLMAGDMDVTETVRAGQRQTQRSSPGSYDFVAMQTATTSLPAQPSLVRPGRQVQPPLAPIFSQDTSTSSSTRRSRGRPRKEGGQYQCDKCGQCLSSKQALKRHLAEYTITARDGQTKTELLCVVKDAATIKQLKAAKNVQSGQQRLQLTTPNNGMDSTAAATASIIDAPSLETDEFGFTPEPGDCIVPDAQTYFWTNDVLVRLPDRTQHGGTEGRMRLNAGLFHVPPEPCLNGARLTLSSFMLVPIFVWAPTYAEPRICQLFQPDGQAPCPVGGWAHSTTHQSWTSRYVHAEERHFWAYSKIHYCKDCSKRFAAWNPDSMAFWPVCVQRRLHRVIYIGRKSAVVRTLASRAIREAPLGMEMEHLAKEVNERKVAFWRALQAEYESRCSIDLQHPAALSIRGRVQPWPAFDSIQYGGRMLTAAIMRTCVGIHLAKRVKKITLRLQSYGGTVWSSDDAFKRCMRLSGPAVMDNTLGNEHHQIIGFWTVFSKATREMMSVGYGGVVRRYRLHGMPMPTVHYVDNPRQVQALLGGEPAIVPSLSDGSKYHSRNYLRYGNNIMICDNIASAIGCVAALRANIKNACIGFDIEWEYVPHTISATTDTDTTQRPTVLSFGTQDLVVILHMAKLRTVPTPFVEIMQDAAVLKVGANIGGDCKLIDRFFQIDTKPTTCVLHEAKQQLSSTSTGRWGLADVCDTVLCKKMSKDELLRCSFTNDQEHLTMDQQQYLAVDCVVPLLIHHAFSIASSTDSPTSRHISDSSGADDRVHAILYGFFVLTACEFSVRADL